MPKAPRPRLGTLLTVAGPGFLLLAACGGGATADGAKARDAKLATTPSCAGADSTAIGLAVLDFITKAEPLPKRFLSAAGTDSAVPDDGFAMLQEKGPTYFYSSDSVAQRKIREKLEEVGPYPSMLVVFRGSTETENGNTVTVRLGGHYVGGDDNGTVSPTRSFEMRCDTTGWKIAASKTEAGA